MKRVSTVLILLLFSSCKEQERTGFYIGCQSGMDLSNGIEISDSLGYFSYRIPDSTWKPERFLDDNGNGLIVGDTTPGYLRSFNVNQTNYTYPWDWGEEQKNVEKHYNVIETGNILLKGKKRKYNIVLFEKVRPQLVSMYVSVLDTINRRLYTLTLTTEYSENHKARICEMKPMLESFKIKAIEPNLTGFGNL